MKTRGTIKRDREINQNLGNTQMKTKKRTNKDTLKSPTIQTFRIKGRMPMGDKQDPRDRIRDGISLKFQKTKINTNETNRMARIVWG